MPMRQEQPKPVLGSQPSPPRATAIKYMEPKYPVETGLEIVSSKPYYQEEEQQGSYLPFSFINLNDENSFH